MSTTPESTRADDRIVAALSRWLARHISDEDLRGELARVGTGELSPDQTEAVEELPNEREHGVCLTVVDNASGRLGFDVAAETLRRAKPFQREVNLEAALRAGDPLGGHYVQGHVDGVGRVRSSEPEGRGRRVWIEAPQEVLRYCVEKGSIAVDGVSLTIAGLGADT